MKPAVRRTLWLVLALAAAVAVFVLCRVADTLWRGRRVAVTISKETTYITEPLRADGYPDYVAALNQRMSEGVTPENNAAVLFWQAMGPGEIAAQDRARYFAKLGMVPPPEAGDYFVMNPGKVHGLRLTADEAENWSKQLGPATERPWTKEEFPILAAWLAANEKPLILLVEASRRPRLYDPHGCESDSTWPVAEQFRFVVGNALSARAMLRLGEGKVDEAWEDILVGHRVSRLVGQGAFVINTAVSTGVEAGCCIQDQAFLKHARLSASQALKMRADLASLPPLLGLADKLEMGERLLDLDDVIAEAGNRSPSIRCAGRDGLRGPTSWEAVRSKIGKAAINWDLVLRTYNSTYDAVAEAVRKPTRAERKRAIGEASRRLGYNEAIIAEHWQSLLWSSIVHGPSATSADLARNRLILHLGIAMFYDMPDRAVMRLELTKLAFALAAYRADNGSYPAALAELVPKYLAEVPKDIFTDADLHYARQDGGYLLYSVGVNGKDDGGRGEEDRKEGEECDDIAVRMTEK